MWTNLAEITKVGKCQEYLLGISRRRYVEITVGPDRKFHDNKSEVKIF